MRTLTDGEREIMQELQNDAARDADEIGDNEMTEKERADLDRDIALAMDDERARLLQEQTARALRVADRNSLDDHAE